MSKISELSDGGVIQGGDTLIAVRSGGNVKVTYGGSTTANIDGGTIDGTVIGGSTAAAITGTTITGTSFVSSGDMTFGDNDKAVFGAGSDLQIYHSGVHSFIDDAGQGNLYVRGNSIQMGKYTGEIGLRVQADDTVTLYYDNAEKLATTSTGIDVTGTVTADGLNVDSSEANILGGSTLTGATTTLIIGSGTNTADSIHGIQFRDRYGASGFPDGQIGAFVQAERDSTGGDYDLVLGTTGDNSADAVQRLRIEDTGDISFYEDTGTTAKFFWDASAESLGIGTTTPNASYRLDVFGSALIQGNLRVESTQIRVAGASSAASPSIQPGNDADTGMFHPANNNIGFSTAGVERARIDSAGNILFGATDTASTSFGAKVLKDGSASEIFAVHRQATDGDLIQFARGGNDIGSIGADSGDLVIDGASSHPGIRFVNSYIQPRYNGVASNGVVDIGSSAARFKDLYLSGGVYLGGTAAANKLDDYEEGTFTPTLTSAGNTGATTLTTNVARYTKIGNVVHIFCSVTGDANLCEEGDYFQIGGLPFAAKAAGSSVSPFNGVSRASASLINNRNATGICTVFEGGSKIDVYTNVPAFGSAVGATTCTLTVSYEAA